MIMFLLSQQDYLYTIDPNQVVPYGETQQRFMSGILAISDLPVGSMEDALILHNRLKDIQVDFFQFQYKDFWKHIDSTQGGMGQISRLADDIVHNTISEADSVRRKMGRGLGVEITEGIENLDGALVKEYKMLECRRWRQENLCYNRVDQFRFRNYFPTPEGRELGPNSQLPVIENNHLREVIQESELKAEIGKSYTILDKKIKEFKNFQNEEEDIRKNHFRIESDETLFERISDSESNDSQDTFRFDEF